MELKYLFVAFFNDGSKYEQNAEDVSGIDPTRSCFYDVLQKEGLEIFILQNSELSFGVNLIDGSFYVNRVNFNMHNMNDEYHYLKDFKLIFFRRHTRIYNGSNMEIGHKVVYQVGWETTDAEGKNIQRVMTME